MTKQADNLQRQLFVFSTHRLRYAPGGATNINGPLAAIEARLAEFDRGLGNAVDDLADLIEWLREERLFAQADRLRTITGRVARLRREYTTEGPEFIRTMARTWPDPLLKGGVK